MISNIKDIEIFSQVDTSRVDKVASLFSELTFDKGASIVQYGKPVEGLYLVEDGEVDVSIPDFEGILARLGKGKSFGELSLFNADDTASATVSVSSDSATVNFCPRQALMDAILGDELLAAGFYHGSALMVADRLRTTNQKISGEIAKSMKMATALIEEISLTGDLGVAQAEIETSGTNIVSGMTEILKELLVMKQTGESVPPEKIAALADNAKDLYYSEFPIFEMLHKQLKALGGHLDNVTRILNQQEMVEVDEDMTLLDL